MNLYAILVTLLLIYISKYFNLLCFWCLTACSTVLVPARVVQALNLNLGDMCCGARPQIQHQFNGRYTPDTGKVMEEGKSSQDFCIFDSSDFFLTVTRDIIFCRFDCKVKE